MKQRLARLRSFLKERQLSGIIISKPENRRYFSGFTGSAGILFVTKSQAKLITDFRYIEQSSKEAVLYEVIKYDKDGIYAPVKKAAEQAIEKIAFESDFTTYAQYNTMSKILSEAELIPVELDPLRSRKDQEELRSIKKAVEIADAAFTHILSFLKPGVSEQMVAAELEYKMKWLGAEKTAFDTIVASGKRGALPHGTPSGKLIELGDFVTMDFGAVYNGYHSDITRTVAIGKADVKQREIYQIVLEAQLAGVAAVKAGLTGQEIDASARNIITKRGYGQYFGHGLGHALGLYIHEEPRLSPTNTTTALETNMVVTVEPGIYLPDWGGVRIEDTVVVCETGCEVLTASDKQLIEI